METQRCPVGDVTVSQSFVDFHFELLEFGIAAVTVVLEPGVSVLGHDGEEILIVSESWRTCVVATPALSSSLQQIGP